METAVVAQLAPGAKTSPPGKEFVCRQLSIIGTEASVPTLARLLNDPSMAEMARYSLARIPGPAAGAALRKSLPRPGVIHALGERRDAAGRAGPREPAHRSDTGILEARSTRWRKSAIATRSPPSGPPWELPPVGGANPFFARIFGAPTPSGRGTPICS